MSNGDEKDLNAWYNAVAHAIQEEVEEIAYDFEYYIMGESGLINLEKDISFTSNEYIEERITEIERNLNYLRNSINATLAILETRKSL